MYVLSVNMWFQNLMRTFFFNIDKIVFNFISTIYDLLIEIARTSILSQADILDMADRVYKLLAVFMVFKVTFSLIMYVVNPDDFSDKSKGVSKLGVNIVFSLAMLIITPYIFNYAYQFQTIILEDNALTTLVFGEDTENTVENPINTAGDSMAFIAMSPFFTPNLSLEIPNCSSLTVVQNNEVVFNPECSGMSYDGSAFSNYNDQGTLYALTMDDEGKTHENFSEQTLKNYIAGVTHGNLALMFRLDMATATDSSNSNFIMEYRYIFSTVVGIVVVLLLLSFCLDVAVRSIKLAFLQLIAPIPILSYVDPKSGKDGMFKKWYQMCFKTYLSLFLRLLALYFAVYIISRVDNMVDIIDGSYQTNGIIKIFVIIGALMFAKSFVKILEGLGIKLDGGFQLNPLRKIEKEALGGGILKKPNDMLSKAGKAIMMSPFSTAGTLGKKVIAGTYSAANGRSFNRGWQSVDWPLRRMLNKKIDEWAPDFAKDRQEARVARLDAIEGEKQDKKVEKYFSGDRKKGNAAFKKDLQNMDPEYARLYRDADDKKIKMYDINARAGSWVNAIHTGRLDAQDRAQISEYYGSDQPLSDNELVRRLQKDMGSAEKQHKKAEEAKVAYGKTSPSARRAAALDKAYDDYDKLHPQNSELIPEYTSEEKNTKSENKVEEDSQNKNAGEEKIIESEDKVEEDSRNQMSEKEKQEQKLIQELEKKILDLEEQKALVIEHINNQKKSLEKRYDDDEPLSEDMIDFTNNDIKTAEANLQIIEEEINKLKKQLQQLQS